jgi:stearoyl-CoA desaturase (Delta-9 desaturase)
MFKTVALLFVAYIAALFLIPTLVGGNGIFESAFESNTGLKIFLYIIIMSHLTITMMSLSFHRYHTHKGVIINKFLDTFMQTWLWFVTSMSKLDWVSVHIYHHAHSDQNKDPHSPVQKGFWRVFLLGIVDYAAAKDDPEVLKIRKVIKTNKYERFIAAYSLSGPIVLTLFNFLAFGMFWGSILSIINFGISPLFAVGGVNAVAHMWGYKNHKTSDNSRNIGFLFPLNFIICGELDHNNHHARPKSCSFRHRWFEFDFGYFYLKIMNFFKLADIKNAYTTKTLKADLAQKVQELLEKDFRFHRKLEEMAEELNISYLELKANIISYVEGRKVELERPVKELIAELKRTIRANMRLNLTY